MPKSVLSIWIPLAGTEALGYVSALETDGHRLYAGTWEEVYISLENGDNWRSTEPRHGVNAIAIDRNNIYAATCFRDVFRSDSHGDTWNPKNSGIRMWERDNGERGYPTFSDILVTSSGTVITVGYTGGTYISNNRGETWHNVADDWIRPGRDDPRGFPPLYIVHRIRSMTEFDDYLWTTSLPVFSVPLTTAKRGNILAISGTARFATGRCLMVDYTSVWYTALSDRLWSVETGAHIQTLTGHTRGIKKIAFNPDGNTIMSGSADKSIAFGMRRRAHTSGHLEGIAMG